MLIWFGTWMIRAPHERRQKKNNITVDRKTTLEKFLLFGAFLGMAILPLFYVFSSLLAFANYSLPVPLQILGVVLVPITLWLFYRSHKDLGLNWSPTLEMRAEHTLVTKGVYKKVRHPMYTSIWILVIAQALLLNNYVAGLSGLLFFGVLYFLRVAKEEQMMLQQFGDQYQDYMQVTGRLMPKF